MKKDITEVLERLDKWIGDKKEDAYENSYHFIPNCKLTILGQMGLIVDEDIAMRLSPIATADLDAWIDTESSIKKELIKLLKEKNLVLDELSNEIWLPPEYEVENFFSGEYVNCLKVRPIYLLVSKAVKAKEKNKILIQTALAEYEDELADMIEKYGGNLDYFLM